LTRAIGNCSSFPQATYYEQVGETIERGFGGELLWIRAELTDVKPYPDKRWCFLKLIEKRGGVLVAEARATFWGRSYPLLDKFRQVTGNTLTSGLELTLGVMVSFHPRYGLNLEVLDIDFAFALGQMELTRRQTFAKTGYSACRRNPLAR
jgi:exodeoxyribonuclease VII large subunit